jgi:hypothetical protein
MQHTPKRQMGNATETHLPRPSSRTMQNDGAANVRVIYDDLDVLSTPLKVHHCVDLRGYAIVFT